MLNIKEIYADMPDELFQNEDGKYTASWCDGEIILCWNEFVANKVADYLESMYDVVSETGFYDVEEDKRGNCVDRYTGWWYVDFI